MLSQRICGNCCDGIVSGSGKKLGTGRTVVKSMWNKSEINRLTKQLDRATSALQLSVTLDISDKCVVACAKQRDNFGKLDGRFVSLIQQASSDKTNFFDHHQDFRRKHQNRNDSSDSRRQTKCWGISLSPKDCESLRKSC